MSVLECVPNLSVGSRALATPLVEAVERVPGVVAAPLHVDADHGRSVLTFFGSGPSLADAVARLATEAYRRLDFRRSTGVHPRIGALDVVPFVPLSEGGMHEASAIARDVAESLANAHGVPVFLYGEARVGDGFRRPFEVRRLGLEGLGRALAVGSVRPDYGPARLDPRRGAVLVGARPVLVAFNLVLASNDLELARELAKGVRESSGGLPAVQALGLELPGTGRVQVSTNVLDHRQTSLFEIFSAVDRRARARGCAVAASEIVGLVPRAALESGDPESLRLERFDADMLIETHTARLGLEADLVPDPAVSQKDR